MSRRNRKRGKKRAGFVHSANDLIKSLNSRTDDDDEQEAYMQWLEGSAQPAVKRLDAVSKPYGSNTETAMRYAQPKTCHVGMQEVFDLGGATVWAGSLTEAFDSNQDWALMVSVAGDYGAPNPVIKASPVAQRWLDAANLHTHETPWIAVEWPDYGVPHLGRDDWRKLTEIIAAQTGPVAIYCVGGHGRTGTALAIIAALGGAMPETADPVAWVRANYCEEVVESRSQLLYIEAITGHDVREKPAEKYVWDYHQHTLPYQPPSALPASSVASTTTSAPVYPTPHNGLIEGFDGEQRVIFNAAGDIIWREKDGEPGPDPATTL